MIAAPLQNAQTLYLAEENHAKTGSACLAVVEAKNLLPLAKDFLAAGFHLEDISGLVVSEGAFSVYHFDHFDKPCRATVLVMAPHHKAVFPSISSVYQGAEWHERETRDFYGFIYEGNPNLVPLLLADDMADVHPLAKPEEARASLATLFSMPERQSKRVRVAEGFTMLDLPAKEEPAPEVEQTKKPAPEVTKAESEAKTAPAKEATLPDEAKPTPTANAPETAAKPVEKAVSKPVAKPAPKGNDKAKPPTPTKKPVKPTGNKGA